MLAMWCWLQPFGQPLILMWIRLVSGSSIRISSRRSWRAWLSPIELVMPSLQESVPGQDTTSVISSAPASSNPSSPSRCHTSYTLSSRTHRSTRFCCTLVRA